MLVALIGPSGAGKSTLMRMLTTICDYSILRVVTTRPPRGKEIDRMSVSESEFARMKRSGAFLWTNSAFGYNYGIPRRLLHSLHSVQPTYFMDPALEDLHEISRLPGHKVGFIILPPSWNELARRLVEKGRSDRLKEVRCQYERYEAVIANGTPELIDNRIVINESAEKAAQIIYLTVDSLQDQLLREARTPIHNNNKIAILGQFDALQVATYDALQ